MQWSWRAGGALWRCAPVAAASGALSLPPPLLAATVAPAPVCVCVQRWVCMYAMHTHEHAQTQPIQNTWMCAGTHACIHAKMHSRKSPTAGSCLSYTQKRRPQLLGHTRKHHQEFVHSRRGHLITAAGILLWCVREPQGRPVAHHRRHRLGWRRLACVRVRRRVSMGGVLTTVCLPQEHKCLYMHVKPRFSRRATEVAYLALLLAGIDVTLG